MKVLQNGVGDRGRDAGFVAQGFRLYPTLDGGALVGLAVCGAHGVEVHFLSDGAAEALRSEWHRGPEGRR